MATSTRLGTLCWQMKEKSLPLMALAHPQPGGKVLEEYGFTVENVVSRVKALMNK